MKKNNIESNVSSCTHWSYSKSKVFHRCPRKFYYRYIKDESPLDSNYFSINMKNLSSIIGISVHREIASQIQRWVDGDRVSFRRAKKSAKKWIDELWANKRKNIIEANNDFEIDDQVKNKINRLTKENLKTFFKAIWPQFRNHEYINHEEFCTFKLKEKKVGIKIDFCTRDQEGNLLITDWKTSKPPALRKDSSQLHAYTLWGEKFLEENLDKIKIQIGYTRTGELSISNPTSDNLSKIKEKIVSECNEWVKTNDKNDYPPAPDKNKCKGCRFLKTCEEGFELFNNEGFKFNS